MPIYEYECESCNEVTEALQKFSDAPLETCPKCGGAVHKLVSLGSFQLKGSGWYVTDYAGKRANGASGESAGSSSEGGSSDSKAGDAGSSAADGGSCASDS